MLIYRYKVEIRESFINKDNAEEFYIRNNAKGIDAHMVDDTTDEVIDEIFAH